MQLFCWLPAKKRRRHKNLIKRSKRSVLERAEKLKEGESERGDCDRGRTIEREAPAAGGGGWGGGGQLR
jgi:hypothetical protein